MFHAGIRWFHLNLLSIEIQSFEESEGYYILTQSLSLLLARKTTNRKSNRKA